MSKTPEEQLGVSLPAEPEPQQITAPEPEAAPETEERPAWLPEKFKSPEELARSYVELETKRNQDAQEKNQLAERLAALEAEQQQPQWDQNQFYDPYAEQQQLAQLYEEDPVAATRAVLQQELAQMQAAQAQQWQTAQQQNQPLIQAQQETQYEMMGNLVSQRMAQTYPDWEDYQPKAQEILMNRSIPPNELQHLPSFQRHVEEAYKLAKYDALSERETQLQAAGFDQTEIDRQMKMAAQTMTGRSARVEEQSPQEQKAEELLAAHRNSQSYGSWASQNLG